MSQTLTHLGFVPQVLREKGGEAALILMGLGVVNAKEKKINPKFSRVYAASLQRIKGDFLLSKFVNSNGIRSFIYLILLLIPKGLISDI